VIGTAAIAIALLIAICKFLDEFFLTQEQKQKLATISLRTWSWLDGKRNVSLFEPIKSRAAMGHFELNLRCWFPDDIPEDAEH
jgi:hypothetical protein